MLAAAGMGRASLFAEQNGFSPVRRLGMRGKVVQERDNGAVSGQDSKADNHENCERQNDSTQ